MEFSLMEHQSKIWLQRYMTKKIEKGTMNNDLSSTFW